MEVIKTGWSELIRLYHELNRSLTWKDVVVYTSIPVVTWWTYKILIQPYLSPLRKIPGRPYIPIVGNMFSALRKEAMSNTIDWMLEANSKIIRYYYLYGEERILVADPEAIRYINVTNWQNFQHSNQFLLRRFPHFLLALTGDEHKNLRKLINPTFGRIVVESYISSFQKFTNVLMDEWKKEIGNNKSSIIGVQDYISRLTLDVICECAFDYKMNCLVNPHAAGVKSFRTILVDFRVRLSQMIPLIRRMPFKANVERWEDEKFFYNAIQDVMNKKRNLLFANGAVNNSTGKDKSDDLLSLLLKARDEDNQGLSDDVILSNVGGFLFAGFETTSTALTWTLLNLAENPEIQDKTRAEILKIFPNKDKPVTRRDLDKLAYLSCVVNESLRMYPPATLYSRKTIKNDELMGYKIPAGTVVSVSVNGLHRHPDNWKDPEKFIPERFQEEYDHNKFMPFAGGPLMCIGSKFAMNEIMVVLTMLLQNFKFTKVPDFKYRRVQNLTVVPDPQLILNVERI